MEQLLQSWKELNKEVLRVAETLYMNTSKFQFFCNNGSIVVTYVDLDMEPPTNVTLSFPERYLSMTEEDIYLDWEILQKERQKQNRKKQLKILLSEQEERIKTLEYNLKKATLTAIDSDIYQAEIMVAQYTIKKYQIELEGI